MCSNESDPVEIPIDGILDLHTFQPREVKELVADYLAECRERGILQVRIIHGKGTGALRETVHSVLRRLPDVVGFRLAGDPSGWGATIVTLRGPSHEDPGRADPGRADPGHGDPADGNPADGNPAGGNPEERDPSDGGPGARGQDHNDSR
jgi:hypothetical protein